MAYNKIIYGGKTLIDLTGDTVTADKLLKGVTAHDMSGESITGTCNYDSDTSGATAVVAEILLVHKWIAAFFPTMEKRMKCHPQR